MTEKDQSLEVREYEIDGNTAVDDLIFAGLHAEMDKRVLDVLAIQTLNAAADPAVLRAALDKANSMLEDTALNDEGLEEMSSTSSDASSEDEQNFAFEEGEYIEGDDKYCAEDMMAKKLLELPVEMRLDSIPEYIGSDEILMLVGEVVCEVEEMVTVSSIGTGKLWELASICCDGDRKVLGYIVDTMGPTTEPFYVISKTRSDPVAPGTKVFTTQRSTYASVV